jgi:AcrR family transcriptional regulator
MSPRPAPTREDTTACQLLGLAAELIDAMLAPAGAYRPPRLRSLRIPATLEWLRIEDVTALAARNGKLGLGRKALLNRWPTKDEFLKDAVVYALLYKDRPIEQVLNASQIDRMPRVGSLSEAIVRVADPYMSRLLEDPRSFLLMHVGPILDQHPDVRGAVMSSVRGTSAWFDGYSRLLRDLGLTFRPGWSVERFGLAMQSIVDGFLLRYRIQPEDLASTRWENASLFADTVIAACLGVIDTERSSHSSRLALDLAAGYRSV